jgi:hypothetical protein
MAQESPIVLGEIPVMRVGPGGRVSRSPGGPTDSCNVIATLTDASFTGGSYILEAGMAQTEMAAATYTVAASEFPITINLAEVILATSGATEQTTTEWSMLFFSGTPTTGQLIATYSSDDVAIPHARVGPGTAGVDIQFGIDPSDPAQLIIPDNGSHTFTLAFRIDHHNQQTGDPCFTPPPTCCNAFPCVDTSGLQNPGANWLFGVNCGGFGCPPNGGWATFSALTAGLCRPSGDWVMRATWSGVNCTPGVGACCRADGTCQVAAQTSCTNTGDIYRGDGTDCSTANCPTPTGACCSSSGGCLVRTQASCSSLGGTWLGAGTACNGTQCPTGACCLVNGSCVLTQTSAACTSQGGVFRGPNTTCATANCPQPTGACCTATGCDLLSQSDCSAFGGVWQGANTTCAVCSPSGACCTAGGCDVLTQSDCAAFGGVWHGGGSTCATACPPCYANCDGSTGSPRLTVNDFVCFQTQFAAGASYANCDGSTTAPVLTVNDFICFQTQFAAGCP